MEPIQITVKDFLSKIAAPRGITINDIERQLKQELSANHDYANSVGPDGQLYIISAADIKAYFDSKLDKPKEFAPPVEKELEEMVDFGLEKPATGAPVKGPKKDAK